MSTSRPKAKPAAAEQPTGPEAMLDGAVPDDEQELRQDIERTREQLGETVEQLAAKADVKARTRAKAADLAGQVKGKTAPAWEAAPEPLRRTLSKGASAANQRRVPLAAAAASLVAAYLAFRWWRRR